jgi:hypothetical protein
MQADRQKVSGGPVDCCNHVRSEALGKVRGVGRHLLVSAMRSISVEYHCAE